MVRYAFDLYPRTDPRDGAVVRRFEHLLEASYRAEENGTGSGQIKVAGDSADGEDIDPRGLQYVRVLEIDDSDVETVKGGFWLEQGKFQALTRKETKHLEFGGAGTLAYLQRAVMWSRTYIHGVFTGQDPIGTTWDLANQSSFYANGNHLGAMLWRVIYEAQHFRSGPYTHRHFDYGDTGITHTGTHADDRTESAIPDLVMTFDQNEDSAGNPWTLTAGTFTAQVGESVLSVVRRLMEMGLKVEMDPDTFELNAWEAPHRTDRTSATWASGKVLFQAPTAQDIDTGNILSDTIRTIRAFIQRSIVLAGSENVYAISEGASDIPWEGGYRIDTEDTGTAEAVAARQRLARSDAVDHLKVVMKLGNAPLQGRYRPWVHVNPGDLVTVDTGADQWEFDTTTFPVAALTVELKQGGDWRAIAELGSSFTSLLEPAFQTGGNPAHTHPPNPQLCRPASIATGSDGFLVSGCSNSGTNILSDYAPWSGDREERVEVTLPSPVGVGESLIAVATNTRIHSHALQVYDEQGNTWTLDASHENTVSSLDDYVSIWRCNVTNALNAGDYIRFAGNVGASLSATAEVQARCIGVYRFGGVLSGPTAGTGAGSFGGSGTINTPAGDVVVAAITNNNEAGMGAPVDPDWLDMIPYVAASGRGVLAQLLRDAGATTFTSDWIGGSQDWAAIAVSYDYVPDAATAINDGHPDLVGSSSRAARCDHRHDVHRDTAPTADDDWATQGYKLGTIWAQLDDLETPTEIVAVWMLIDDSTGAAVWAPWPGSGITLSDDTPLVESGSGDEGTSNEASRSDHVHPADAGGSGGLTVPDLLNSPAPGGGNDAEFDGTIAPFTAVDGTSGVAVLDDSAGGQYDVATRDGWVLMVVGTASGDSVQLKQDVTLADGACIVAAVSFALDQAAASANNEVQIGIGVNSDDSGPNAGLAATQMHALVDSEASGAMRVIGFDGTTALGELPGSNTALGLWYLRIDRVGLTYIAHASKDGFSWARLGSKLMGAAANNVWLYANCGATMTNRIVVGCPWFRFGTGMAVDPFPLT